MRRRRVRVACGVTSLAAEQAKFDQLEPFWSALAMGPVLSVSKCLLCWCVHSHDERKSWQMAGGHHRRGLNEEDWPLSGNSLLRMASQLPAFLSVSPSSFRPTITGRRSQNSGGPNVDCIQPRSPASQV